MFGFRSRRSNSQAKLRRAPSWRKARHGIEPLEQRILLTVLPLTTSANTPGLASGFASGSLTATNDRNSFDVDLLAGDQISAMTSGTVDTRLEFKNSAGGVLTSDTRAGPGNQPFISAYTVGVSGRYTVDVISENGSGSFTVGVNVGHGLALESDAGYSNDSTGGANTLAFTASGNTQTASVAGTIMGSEGSNPDKDRYQLGTLNAGTTITLSTRLPNWSTLEPQVRVFRLNGSTPVYLTDTDSSDGGFSGTTDADGVYYAEVYTTKAVLNGQRYTFNANSVTWTAAEATAVTAGGHLASIPSQQVQSALVDTFGQSGYWVGLNDAATEGTFAWSDGTPLTYTNWYQGSPVNNSANNDYVYFLTTGGLWYVTSNTDTHASVSQNPAEAGAPALSTAGISAQYVLDVSVTDSVPPVVTNVSAARSASQ